MARQQCGDNGFKLPTCGAHQEGCSLYPSTGREDWDRPTSDCELLQQKHGGCDRKDQNISYYYYRRDVVRVSRIKYSRRQPLYTMPCPPALPRSPMGQSVAEAIRYDERGHYPGQGLQQWVGRHCGKRATVMCVKCQAPLHIHCFEAFHEKWWKATWSQWIDKRFITYWLLLVFTIYNDSLYLLNGLIQYWNWSFLSTSEQLCHCKRQGVSRPWRKAREASTSR